MSSRHMASGRAVVIYETAKTRTPVIQRRHHSIVGVRTIHWMLLVHRWHCSTAVRMMGWCCCCTIFTQCYRRTTYGPSVLPKRTVERVKENKMILGVLSDLLCLSVGSRIIADCGLSSSGEAKAFTDGQRSGASGDPAPGRVRAQFSEALITASAHRDQRQNCCRKGLHPSGFWSDSPKNTRLV